MKQGGQETKEVTIKRKKGGGVSHAVIGKNILGEGGTEQVERA